jgi:hypothetical protein
LNGPGSGEHTIRKIDGHPVSGIKRKAADVAPEDDDDIVETAGPSGGTGKKARKGVDLVVWVLKDVLAELEEMRGDLKEISHTQIQYVSTVIDAFQKMTQEIRDLRAVTGGVQQLLEMHRIKGVESTMGSSAGKVETEMEVGGEMVIDDEGPVAEEEAGAEAEAVAGAENAPATE